MYVRVHFQDHETRKHAMATLISEKKQRFFILTKIQIVNELFHVRAFHTNTVSLLVRDFVVKTEKNRMNYSTTPLTPPNFNAQYAT